MKCVDLNKRYEHHSRNYYKGDEEGKTGSKETIWISNVSAATGLIEVVKYFEPAPEPGISCTHKGIMHIQRHNKVKSNNYRAETAYPCPGTGGYAEYINGTGRQRSLLIIKTMHNITFFHAAEKLNGEYNIPPAFIKKCQCRRPVPGGQKASHVSPETSSIR